MKEIKLKYTVECSCGNKELPIATKNINPHGLNTYGFCCKDCKIIYEITEEKTKNALEIKLNGGTIYLERLEK